MAVRNKYLRREPLCGISGLEFALGLGIVPQLIGGAKAAFLGAAGTPTRSVQPEVGSFVKQTGTGNQDITIATDLTGAASGTWAVIFWLTGSEAASGTQDDHNVASLGFAANGGGTVSQYAVAATSEDAASTSNASRAMAAKVIVLNTASASGTYASDVIADAEMGATPFPSSTTMRINWTTNSASTPFATCKVNYAIISGLTGAKAFTFEPSAGTGNKTVSGLGVDLTDDGLVFLASYGTNSDPPSSIAGANFSFGVFNQAGEQWCNTFTAEDNVADSNTSRYQRTDKCIATLNTGSSSVVNSEAQFVSVANGEFVINFTTNASAVQHIGLAVSGVQSKIGAFTQTSGSAPHAQSVSVSPGFTPVGAFFAHYHADASTSPRTHAVWSLGAYDGSAQRSALAQDIDAEATMAVDSVWHSSAAIINTDGSATPSLNNVGAVSALSSSGFTVTWDPSTAHGFEVLYLLIG